MERIGDAILLAHHLIDLRDHFASIVRWSEVVAVPQLSEEGDVRLDENTRISHLHVI